MVGNGGSRKGRVRYCSVCGYGYADRKTARACEVYCRTNNACSSEITRKAVKKPGADR